jgi:hypothetical protein
MLARAPWLTRSEPLDEPELRALNLFDLKADAGQIVPWLPEQMIRREAERHGLQEPPDSSHDPPRDDNIITF